MKAPVVVTGHSGAQNVNGDDVMLDSADLHWMKGLVWVSLNFSSANLIAELSNGYVVVGLVSILTHEVGGQWLQIVGERCHVMTFRVICQ